MSNTNSTDTLQVKSMRWAARFLSISWAFWALFLAWFAVAGTWGAGGPLKVAVSVTALTVFALMTVGAAFIASVWGKEAFGGWVLVVDGVLTFAIIVVFVYVMGTPEEFAHFLSGWQCAVAFFAMSFPALLAGALFVVSAHATASSSAEPEVVEVEATAEEPDRPEVPTGTMRKKTAIALLIILVPVAVVALLILLKPENYSITTEKDSSFDKKVERIFVITKVEERLKPVFAHSFEHSMISAFESNGVDAIVTVTSPESDSLTDNGKEAERFAPDATMRININALYRTRDDGYQAIVGTDFEASLIDIATENRVWHATGKVDYIWVFGSHYKAGEGIRKEFAWNTTAAIVRAFIAEVNGQKPAPIYNVTEERQRHGQRVD